MHSSMAYKLIIGILLLAAIAVWVFAPGDIAGVFIVIAIAAIAISSRKNRSVSRKL